MDPERIDLNRVAMFVNIADAGGVTAAASRLKLPKSSVSRGLTQLETELGVELVVRSSRRFRLTDAGRAFFDAASKGIATVNNAREEMRRDKAVPRGLVRIAAPPVFASAIIAPVVARFVQEYPEVRVEIFATGRQVDPVRDEVDIVIAVGALADSSLKVRSLGTVEAGVFASAGYLREHGTPKRPSDLARHVCIIQRPSGSKEKWSLTGPTGPAVVAVDGRVRVDDSSTAIAAAAAGAGLVVLPIHLAAVDATAQTLKRVLPEYFVRGQRAQVVQAASRHVPLRVSMLCDAIVTSAGGCPKSDHAS